MSLDRYKTNKCYNKQIMEITVKEKNKQNADEWKYLKYMLRLPPPFIRPKNTSNHKFGILILEHFQ